MLREPAWCERGGAKRRRASCADRYGASEAVRSAAERAAAGPGGAAPGKFSGFLRSRMPGEAIWYLCSLTQIQFQTHKNNRSGKE